LRYDILIFWKHLPQTIEFVDRHPNQPFVVDHIAKPRITPGSFDYEWATGIRELAKRPHVSCKVSGMLTEVRGETWDLDLLRPYFETVYEAFGPQRVMFGSDWPVCLLRSSHSVWTRVCADLTSTLSADEQSVFWGGNAAKFYGF
jgi:L-fuconolactonase